MRAEHDVTLNLKLYGLKLEGKRTFRLEYPELDISSAFEVVDWSLAPDGMSVNVSGKSTKQEDWLFDGLTQEPAPSTITDITVVDTISDPTGVVASSPDVGALYVTFDPAPRSSLLKRVRYRKVGAADWNEVGVPSSQNFVTINGLPPGDVYEQEVQFRTATANASNWVASTPAHVTISTTSTPPNPVENVVVAGGAGEATFSWDAPNSPNYVGSAIFLNTTDTYPGGTPAAVEYGLPNASDSKTISGIGAGTYYGWIVAFNSAEDLATPVATGSFTVT
jgi:hypothetical protein